MRLFNDDCFNVFEQIIKDNEKVDLILTDPPYGSHKCSFDIILPFDEMWSKINKIAKENTPIILFGTQPFTSLLISSNLKNFKYSLIWKKSKCGSPLTAKFRPMARHEDILIFEKKGKKTNYYPIMEKGDPYKRKWTENKVNNLGYGIKGVETENYGTRYPISILDFPQKWRRQDQIHSFQKPVELLEYLIKSYSKEGDLILDFTAGSFSSAIAAYNTKRSFIGIEKDKFIFDKAIERLKNLNINF